MHVTLREITSDTVRAVTKLAVRTDQQGYVATNAVSLAQALFSPEAWYRAVYADEALVGFVMLFDETLSKVPPARPRIGLWRLMIDANHQRRGIGREVMRLVLEYARSRPGIQSFYTSYVPAPGGPGPFYLGLGFQPNGELDDDEVVLLYPALNDRRFVHSRLIDATPECVFSAFAQPERLARWWGPEGFTSTFEVFDLRPGGAWRFVMHGPDGTRYPNENVFRVVEPPHRVVVEHVSEEHHFILGITFTAQAGQTLVGWEQTFDTAAHKEEIAPWVEPANEQNLDRLAREVAGRGGEPGVA